MAIKMVREPSETPNISNIDDIIPMRYAYGGQNGYVINKGAEISYSISGLNFTVNSGRLVLQGVECDIDASGITLSLDNIETKRYYIIYLQVNLATSVVNILSTYDTAQYPTLDLGDDLTQNSSGTARMPLYRFVVENGSFSELTKLVEPIDYTLYLSKIKTNYKTTSPIISSFIEKGFFGYGNWINFKSVVLSDNTELSQDFSKDYIFIINGNIYAHDEYRYYKLNKKMSFNNKLVWEFTDDLIGMPSEFLGKNVWTDGINYYHSNYSGSQKLINKNWNSISWVGAPNGEFVGRNIWSDGNKLYLSEGHIQYEIILSVPTGELSWAQKNWGTFTSYFNGEDIWAYKGKIYLSSENLQKEYKADTDNWVDKVWNIELAHGYELWTNGTELYYSHNDEQFVFDENDNMWVRQFWHGSIKSNNSSSAIVSFNGSEIWTDGDNIYCLTAYEGFGTKYGVLMNSNSTKPTVLKK